MNAREKARRLHWDVEPRLRHERDPAGIKMQELIRAWNAEAAKRQARWLKLAEELKLRK